MPARHSPRARTFTSLSTQTGAAYRADEPLANRIVIPAGHDRRRDRPAARRNSTGPGTPMPIPHSPPGRSRVAAVSSAEQLVDSCQAALRAGGDVRLLVAMAQDAAIEVRHRHVDAGRAEVRDEHVPGVRAEAHLPGRATARCSAPGRSSTTRPSSISSPTRCATTPRLSPVPATSSARDRHRARRISSRIAHERVERVLGPRRDGAVVVLVGSLMDRFARATADLLHLTCEKYRSAVLDASSREGCRRPSVRRTSAGRGA